MSLQFDALTRFNLDDLIASFGCEDRRFFAMLLRRAFRGAARTFADQMMAFDDAVGLHAELGRPSASILEKHYVRALRVDGREHVPTSGPALFLANHPGLTDSIGLAAAINRPDLKILAMRRPFLENLQNVAKHLFFVEDNLGKRVILAHDVAAHLRNGGAVLSFPAGHIEPDPEVSPRAAQALNDWRDSARFIVRLAPQTKIVPTLVRGVVWKTAAQHWLTRIRRTLPEREKLAAALQLLAMVTRDARPATVNVRFAAPLLLADCAAQEPALLHQAVVGRMRQMIAGAPPSSEQTRTAGGPQWAKTPQPTLS
jgi:hypothetical protein